MITNQLLYQLSYTGVDYSYGSADPGKCEVRDMQQTKIVAKTGCGSPSSESLRCACRAGPNVDASDLQCLTSQKSVDLMLLTPVE